MADSLVNDMSLAEFGRKELTLAEHEMQKYGPSQPSKGSNDCDPLVDDGGDATLLRDKCKEFEEKYSGTITTKELGTEMMYLGQI